MAKRDEDRARKKKQRRQKRLQKRRPPGPSPSPLEDDPRLEDLIRTLEAHDVPSPASWPGASDPVLARPDLVKFELTTYISTQEPGRTKLQQLTDGLTKGLLGFLPELDHFAMEEFVWHGLPGDFWHPIDSYLQHKGAFPPAAREQLLLWKEARIGFYEIGEVRDDTVGLREWDPVRDTHGEPFRAVTLNIGGVNVYRRAQGQILLTWVAPWAPADNLFCGMGYGATLDRDKVAPFIHFLGLRHLDVVSRPLPWKVSRAAKDEYLRQWRAREWHSWLAGRMQFPFQAVLNTPQGPALLEVTELAPSTPEDARRFGIYFLVPRERGEALLAGGTAVLPVDVTSENMAALTEYHAYRELAGPPPGMRGQGPFFRLK